MTSTSAVLPPGVRDNALRTMRSDKMAETMTFTKYAHETGGTYTEMTARLPPGSRGTPIHHHIKYQEAFTATSAHGLGIHLDGKDIILKEGETAIVPVGHNHRFFNPTDDREATLKCKIEPGAEGFEKGFHIVYGLSQDGLSNQDGVPRNILHVAVLSYMMDTWLQGWGFQILTPLLAILRWYAVRTGVEKRLIERYWEGGDRDMDGKSKSPIVKL